MEEEKDVEALRILKAQSAPDVIDSAKAISVTAVPLQNRSQSAAGFGVAPNRVELTSSPVPLSPNAADTLATAWSRASDPKSTSNKGRRPSPGPGAKADDNDSDIETGGGRGPQKQAMNQHLLSNDSNGSDQSSRAGSGKFVPGAISSTGLSGGTRVPGETRKSGFSLAGLTASLLGRPSIDETHQSTHVGVNTRMTTSGRLTVASPDILQKGGADYVMNVGNERVSFCRASELAAEGDQTEIPVGEALFPESDAEAEIIKQKFGQGTRRSLAPNKDKLHTDFAFRDYLPQAFHKIRQLSKIDDLDYIDAFTETTRESFSEGRSGAFLYFSKNEKFIVKTTSKREMMKLLQIMPDYVDHISTYPMSILTRYLSAHAIVMYNTTLYFVVMLNIFPGIELSERYDLKGSWIDRNGNNAGE
jgi:hypothetical protein